jgi:hypothetical protein
MWLTHYQTRESTFWKTSILGPKPSNVRGAPGRLLRQHIHLWQIPVQPAYEKGVTSSRCRLHIVENMLHHTFKHVLEAFELEQDVIARGG